MVKQRVDCYQGAQSTVITGYHAQTLAQPVPEFLEAYPLGFKPVPQGTCELDIVFLGRFAII